MNLFNFFLLLNSLSSLLVGGIVYFKRKERLINRIWGLVGVVLFLWSSGTYKALTTFSASFSLVWFRIANLSLVFFPLLFLHLVLSYLEEANQIKKTLPILYGMGIALFIIAVFLPGSFISYVAPELQFRYYPHAGWLYKFFIAMFCVATFYGLLKLAARFLGRNDFRRNQARYLFIGSLFGICGLASFFPLSLGAPVYPAGNYFIILYCLITTYAVTRHHPTDIDALINKAAILVYFVGLTLLLHTGLVYLLYKKAGMEYSISSGLSGGTIMLIFLFIAHFQERLKLNNKLCNIIYEDREIYRKAVEELNKAATSSLDFDDIMNRIIMILADNIGIEQASILSLDRQRSLYTTKTAFGLGEEVWRNFSLPLNNELVKWLKEKCGIFRRDALKDVLPEARFRIIARDLKELEAKISMPIFYKEELVGILNLGDKKNEKPLTQEEIDIINSLTQQTAVYIKNNLLYEDSITDSLTGLYHHEFLYHRLAEEVERAKRYMRPLSLLMIDIDYFKDYNDRYGHQAGDRALKEIARTIRLNTRKVDMVARYGGEEFCVVTPETPKEGGVRLAERLREAVPAQTKELVRNEKMLKTVKPGGMDRTGGITISIGVAALEKWEQNMSRQQLIREADEALYKAKDQGRNRVAFL